MGAVSRETLAKRIYPQTKLENAKRQILHRQKVLDITNLLIVNKETGKMEAWYTQADADRIETEFRFYTFRCDMKKKGVNF